MPPRLDAFLAGHPERFPRLDENTFVLQEARLLYLDTPKTAGTAIKSALMRMEGAHAHELRGSRTAESTPEMLVHDRALNPVPSLTRVPADVAEEALTSPDWLRFCVVRHPTSRLFSAWFSKVLLREPGYEQRLGGNAVPLPERLESIQQIVSLFEDFVRLLHDDDRAREGDVHWHTQWSLLLGDDIDWSVVAHYERLDADLGPVIDHVAEQGVTWPGLPRVNVSGMQLTPGDLKADTSSAIATVYADDFAHFGYPASLPATTGHDALPDRDDAFLLYVNSSIGRNRRVEELHQELMKEEARSADRQRQIDHLVAELEATRRDASARLAEVYESRSWRVTRPLRLPREWAQARREHGTTGSQGSLPS